MLDDLNVPDAPDKPQINPGDYLTLQVGTDKDLQFKLISRHHGTTDEPGMDPAGYLFTEYDQKLIAYLAGQVVKDVYQQAVATAMAPQSIDTLMEVTQSGYYHLMTPIDEIDAGTLWYLEAHFEDAKNGIVLVLGTMYFYTVENGEWSKPTLLKGGEDNDEQSGTTE